MKLTIETTEEQDVANTRAIAESSSPKLTLEEWYAQEFNDHANGPLMRYKQADLGAVTAKLQAAVAQLQPQDLADVLAIVAKYNNGK